MDEENPDYWQGEMTKIYRHSHSNTQTRYSTILQEMALLLHSSAGFDFLFSYGQELFLLKSQSSSPVSEAALFIKMI